MGLRILTPRVELRYPDDEELLALAALSSEEIHDPLLMPFSVPWTRAPSQDRPANSLGYWRAGRRGITPDRWSLLFMVAADGEVLGVQAIEATAFPRRRSVETGSWLVLRAQGRGIGREMRQAVLHFAFAALGADEARSASFVDNPASRRVSEVCGYEHAGVEVIDREGLPALQDQWVLTRSRWEPGRRTDIEVHGFDGNWARRLAARS
jgi:RimJ/RimL family protein N-acetyltransferase